MEESTRSKTPGCTEQGIRNRTPGYKEQGIWSRTPGYTEQGIRSRTPGYTEQVIRNRTSGYTSRSFGIGHPAIRVGHINQFYYASMIRMFAGKALISKVQEIYHKTLDAVLETYQKSFEDLLLMNDDISIHQNHLHFLATEIFNKLILYELRKGNVIHFPPVPSTIFYSLEVCWGILLGNTLPREMKKSNSTEIFKAKLKETGNISCTCTVCR